MNKPKLIVLGDSIMYGITGFGPLHPRAKPTIPERIGELLDWEVDNEAVNATEIAYGNNSLVEKVTQYDFRKYSAALIAYGANDYGLEHETLTTIKDGLVQALKTIKEINPDIKIYLLCPIQSWALNQDDLAAPNSQRVSQNDVCDAIIEIAQRYRLPYYDWRKEPIVTVENRYQTLGDSSIHPTQATMNLMAKRITERMILMANLVSIERGMANGPEKIDENFRKINNELKEIIRVSDEGWQSNVTWLNGNTGKISYCKATVGSLHLVFLSGNITFKEFRDWIGVDVFAIPGIGENARITTPVQAGDNGNTVMYSVDKGVVHATPLQMNKEDRKDYVFQFGGVVVW